MPTIDSERDFLVVRIVYDGPPLSGKTTTLRTLAEGLGVEMTTPEERNGRTLFFDWVEYVGGLFEGRQIRCQIVTVPGQTVLAARRSQILGEADAVVFVADSCADELPASQAQLRELVQRCRSEDPPVGVVVQANKRDRPSAVPIEDVRKELSKIAPVAVVETVATDGEGVREAFVFGIRLAIDRVRAMIESGHLLGSAPLVAGPEALLAELSEIEEGRDPSPPSSAEPASSLAELDREIERLAPYHFKEEAEPNAVVGPPGEEEPFVPDPMMPGGFIWPPVDGRAYLHETSKLGLEPVRTARGDWWVSGYGWRFHSAAHSVFGDAEHGRQALIEWARQHTSNVRWLSQGRSVILADAGAGRYRLWQLVKVEQSIREQLVHTASEADIDQLVGALCDAADLLARARSEVRRSELDLPCTLWTLNADEHGRPLFIGLMPDIDRKAGEELEGPALIEREFRPVFNGLGIDDKDLQSVADALDCRLQSNPTDLTLLALATVASTVSRESKATAAVQASARI